MFTGIITHLAKFQSLKEVNKGHLLSLRMLRPLSGLKVGESISVNGVCLTLHKRIKNHIYFYLLKETIQSTSFSNLKRGDLVNIERALVIGDRLGGHFVTGHIDGVGRIKQVILYKKRVEKSFFVNFPLVLRPLIAKKGSISIEGVSLTVGEVKKDGFWVHLVNYTLEQTTLGQKKKGDRLNVEVDLIARYLVAIKKLD